MKTYRGWIDGDNHCHITVREHGKPGRALSKRLDLFNHSPTGFAWGYGGSGPAQAALALLADALGDDMRALRLYQDFKWKVIAGLHIDQPWAITDEAIKACADRIDKDAAQADDQARNSQA